MRNFVYSSLDVAVIIHKLNVGIQEQSRIINVIWNIDKSFLQYEYWYNKRIFILDVYYWLNYIADKKNLDAEFPIIQRDIQAVNGKVADEEFVSDFSQLDLFFKSVRIMIITGQRENCVKIKLRTMLKRYGCKRRSQKLLEYFYECMDVYHLKTYLKGGKPCDISKVKLDDMIIFRIPY